MVGIKSSPGVSNVQLHLTMTKVNTIRVAVGEGALRGFLLRRLLFTSSFLEPFIVVTC